VSRGVLGCLPTPALIGGEEGEAASRSWGKICFGLLLSCFQTQANKEGGVDATVVRNWSKAS
jgi:hypothetical protein